MSLDNRFSWRLEQSGRVSVTHQRLRGMVKNQVHIQCDCQSDSLLSDIISADRNGGNVWPVAATWLNSQLEKATAPAVAAGAAASPNGAASSPAAKAKVEKQNESREKTLVVRLKSAELNNDELLLTEGEFTLQGEDVFLRDGVPFFQNKSLVTAQPSVGRPVVTGSQVDRKRSEALVAKDGLRNLYFGNTELLDGHRPIIQNPRILFGSDVVPMETVVRRRSQVKKIETDELNKILPNHDKLGAVVAERSRAAKPVQAATDKGIELNKVVLVNGRCMLMDNCIVILRGLLHVGCIWHRIINGILVGSDASHSPHPVTITGRPAYTNTSAPTQMMLSGLTLYSLGNTVYAGNAPLLEDAVLHVDGQVLNISDLHFSSLCGLPPPTNPEPARLFVMGGRFSVLDTGLNIHEGTVWLQDVRMQLPEDTAEEVRVTDSLVFIGPESVSQDAGANKEVRDIIYKDNMLLLDDLTPLLKGGFVCHGEQRQPLIWLSGNPDAIARARSSQMLVVPPEDLSNRVQMLTDATCIVDKNGMYFIEGSMILQGQKVLIDRGVPLFSSETTDETRKMNLGTPPPRLSGRVLLDPDAARELGAKDMEGYIVLKNVHLDMTDGKIVANNRVPVMSDCKLVMDRHVFSPMELGFDAGARAAHAKAAGAAATKDAATAAKAAGPLAAAKASAVTKAAEDAAKVKNAMAKSRETAGASATASSQAGSADDASASPKPPPPSPPTLAKQSAASGAPEKTIVSFAGTSTAEQEDSGRGASDWAESSQRAATALGSMAEAPAKKSAAAETNLNKGADAAAAVSDREGGRDKGKSAGEARAEGSDKMADAELERGFNRESEKNTGGKSGGLSHGKSPRESGGASDGGPSKKSGEELHRGSGGASDGGPSKKSGEELHRGSGGASDGGPQTKSGEQFHRGPGGASDGGPQTKSGEAFHRGSDGASDGGPQTKSGEEFHRGSGGASDGGPQTKSGEEFHSGSGGASDGGPQTKSGEAFHRGSGGASVGGPQTKSGEESGHVSGGESNEEPMEDPNRFSQKSSMGGKDSVADPNRDATANFGRDSIAKPHRESVGDSGKRDGKGSGAESKREADDAGVGSRQERQVPASAALGDASSNGIQGNFSVSSNSAGRKLVFNLKARIAETLHFLDMQR